MFVFLRKYRKRESKGKITTDCDVCPIQMAHLSWWYYISKFLEFSDTIFFVLRKKFSHVSTLHVIHHGVMPMSVWWGVKFTPGMTTIPFPFDTISQFNSIFYQFSTFLGRKPFTNKWFLYSLIFFSNVFPFLMEFCH